MMKTCMTIFVVLLLIAIFNGAESAGDEGQTMELNDKQVENLVRRSYQYVAMYNVTNKFAAQQSGWNTLQADTRLKAGDEVVTSGGVLGRITEAGEQFLKVEVADGVELKVQRTTVSMVMPKGTFKGA